VPIKRLRSVRQGANQTTAECEVGCQSNDCDLRSISLRSSQPTCWSLFFEFAAQNFVCFFSFFHDCNTNTVSTISSYFVAGNIHYICMHFTCSLHYTGFVEKYRPSLYLSSENRLASLYSLQSGCFLELIKSCFMCGVRTNIDNRHRRFILSQ
jgi:hypothetical protein